MKAVLVIDIPNELDVNDLLIDYCVHTKGEYKTIRKGGNHPIKPMPERKDEGSVLKPLPFEVYMYRYGFNECLDEIMGETE